MLDGATNNNTCMACTNGLHATRWDDVRAPIIAAPRCAYSPVRLPQGKDVPGGYCVINLCEASWIHTLNGVLSSNNSCLPCPDQELGALWDYCNIVRACVTQLQPCLHADAIALLVLGMQRKCIDGYFYDYGSSRCKKCSNTTTPSVTGWDFVSKWDNYECACP